MKTCPFCAEEIRHAAIKCKHCGSMLADAPGPAARPGLDVEMYRGPRSERKPDKGAAGGKPSSRSSDRAGGKDEAGHRREVLYRGHPSWRAYFRYYAAGVALAAAGPVLGYYGAEPLGLTGVLRVVCTGAPILLALVWLYALGVYRRSKVVRVSDTSIERALGVLSRKIDVLELSHCRDVAYHQSFSDRLLRIAHLEVLTTEKTTPTLRITGVPASRYLFEKIRDAVVAQRPN